MRLTKCVTIEYSFNELFGYSYNDFNNWARAKLKCFLKWWSEGLYKTKIKIDIIIINFKNSVHIMQHIVTLILSGPANLIMSSFFICSETIFLLTRNSFSSLPHGDISIVGKHIAKICCFHCPLVLVLVQ